MQQLKLDQWQEDVLSTKGNICLVSGRQSGKSTVIAIKAGDYALNNPNKSVMIISAVERQAFHLFEMIIAHIYEKNKYSIKKSKGNPTKSKIVLKNGSVIRCLPTGLTGYGIRGFTIHQLYADEAAHIPEAVWHAVTPMLAVSGGDIILLSTPRGNDNYFYRSSTDDSFAQFRVSSEDCPRIPKDFLEKEKQRMSSLEYKQEYLGQFLSKDLQFFPDNLIKEAMILSRRTTTTPLHARDFFLGVDIARMGEDESTFEVFDATDRIRIQHVESIVTTKTLTTMSTQTILRLNKQYDFKQIFIDDGGMGVGVFDQLLTDESTRRKTIAINNTSRPLSYGKDKEQHKRVTKEDIFNNALKLLERKEVKLLDDPEIYMSLKSVQYTYNDRGKFIIFGRYLHIADGIVRGLWCSKDKVNKLWVSYI